MPAVPFVQPSSDLHLVELKTYPDGAHLLQQYRDRTSPKSSDPSYKGSAYDAALWDGVSDHPGLQLWHALVRQALQKESWSGSSDQDPTKHPLFVQLQGLLAEQVRFHPPTYWKVREGRLVGAIILREACQIFGESFVYHRQLVDATGRNAILEFSTMIEDIPAQGVDILEFSADRQEIVDFKVMLRPPEAALRMKQLMQVRLNRVLTEMGIDMGKKNAK